MRPLPTQTKNCEDESMATFNMTREMAEEYHRATGGGAHPPRQHDARADAMAYAATAKRPVTTNHRCALCDEVIACDMELVESYVTATEAHHAVCPKRPIAVGDYVRWERVRSKDSWIEGELVSITPDEFGVSIKVASFGPRLLGVTAGKVQKCDGPRWKESTAIRRIPRPAAAQACLHPFPWDGSPDGWICRACRQPTNRKATEGPIGGALAVRTAHGDIKITADPICAPGCQCGAHEERRYRPVVVDKAAMERAMRDEKLMQRMQDEAQKRITWIATGGTKAHTLEHPIPALVDGLTREQCSTRWLENRLAVEGGAAPPNALTRMQRDVGRAMWLAGPGAKRSAELRDRVAADREAERNRVRVDVQDVE